MVDPDLDLEFSEAMICSSTTMHENRQSAAVIVTGISCWQLSQPVHIEEDS